MCHNKFKWIELTYWKTETLNLVFFFFNPALSCLDIMQSDSERLKIEMWVKNNQCGARVATLTSEKNRI